jgi:hypothetical protein
MDDEFISGINPLTISKIAWLQAMRRHKHPAWYRIMKKRNPIRGILGFYEIPLFSGFMPATVRIYGSDGNLLKIIECKSNYKADVIAKYLNSKLNNFLKNVRINQ